MVKMGDHGKGYILPAFSSPTFLVPLALLPPTKAQLSRSVSN